MVQAQAPIDVPETWDTIKYPKPIYPTYSQGKVGGALYCNNKFHCYSVQHSKPVYNLTPYRATGFGFAERSMKYVPLTHIQDRSKPKAPKVINEKTEMKKIYEASIDAIKENSKLRGKQRRRRAEEEVEIRNIERNYNNLVNKMRYEIHDLTNQTEDMIGETRYRTHQVNRLMRDHHYFMRS